MTGLEWIVRDALAARVAGGDLAAVERALVRAHGYTGWDAAATAATLCAAPPERLGPLLDRIAARRVARGPVEHRTGGWPRARASPWGRREPGPGAVLPLRA
jgi:hypothetical protein